MRGKISIRKFVSGKKKMSVMVGVVLLVSMSTAYMIHQSDQDQETKNSFPPLLLPRPTPGYTIIPEEYILNATYPEVDDDAAVYVSYVMVTEEEANNIMESLGIPGHLYENETMFFASDGSLHMEIYKNSGAIWYADGDRIFNETNPNLPTDLEAIDISDSYLESHGLMPSSDVYNSGVERSTLSYYYPSNGTNYTVETDVHVYYSRVIDGARIYGPGSSIKVCIGDNGDVVGMWKIWRPWVGCLIEAIITPQEAYQIMQSEGIFTDLQNATVAYVNEITLGYWADPGIIEQTYLQPVYVFTGMAHDAEGSSEPFAAFVAALA